jgi:DNA-binding response OmpR family regulator
MSRLLLVDDEAPIVEVLSRALRARGHEVRAAMNGADGLLALTEEVPDVMLLDISLPDITGWELLRRMSRLDRERVPVIVFSASPLAPNRVREFQPAGVLTKPFPMSALSRLVDEVVRGVRANA